MKKHNFDRHWWQRKRTTLHPGLWFGSVEKQHGESCVVAEVQNLVLGHIFELELNNGIGLIIYGLRMPKFTMIQSVMSLFCECE